MRIALCGGTFDPFHRGHLEPVLAVRDAMAWDRIVYVPAAQQPFKREQRTASAYHRFAMAVLATMDVPAVTVSPRELERAGISYTVDTLEEARAEWPDATLDWVIGDDNLASLLSWKAIGRILELANFAVLARAGEGAATALPADLRSRLSDAGGRGRCGAIVFAENRTVEVSATEIRRRLSAGESVDALVAPAVSRYIEHYGLYRKGHS